MGTQFIGRTVLRHEDPTLLQKLTRFSKSNHQGKKTSPGLSIWADRILTSEKINYIKSCIKFKIPKNNSLGDNKQLKNYDDFK